MPPLSAERHAVFENAVVVDLGAHTLKAGLAAAFPASAEPRVVVSSTLRDASDPSAPPRRACVDGRVSDWDAVEALLARALYTDLGWVAGDEGCLLSVEPIRTPRRDRERWAQLAFERFNAAGLFVLDAPVAALFAAGKASGTVIDVGHDKTDVAAVVEGGLVPGSVLRLPAGGAAVEDLLADRLRARGVDLTGVDAIALRAAKQAVARALPSRAAFLKAGGSGGSGAGKASADPPALTLPDGTAVPLTPADGAALGEALAHPSDAASVRPALAAGEFSGGLAEIALSASVAGATADAPGLGQALLARRAALDAFVLAGGGARVPGLRDRLDADVRSGLPAWAGAPPLWPDAPAYLPPDSAGALASWTGGAVAARVVFIQNQHATRADYDECGPGAIFRRGSG